MKEGGRGREEGDLEFEDSFNSLLLGAYPLACIQISKRERGRKIMIGAALCMSMLFIASPTI